MSVSVDSWDYLIVTASNEVQAAAYAAQLRTRQGLGLLAGVRDFMVIPDPVRARIGSGGSTILCLLGILNRRLPPGAAERGDPAAWVEALRDLRILILHAGGDSRRLPSYGHCGKAFIPVPSHSDSALGPTLFDCQLPTYLALRPPEGGTGQIVVTSGDVLLRFDPSKVRFAPTGVTGLGCQASPRQASGHGVFCADSGGSVRLYLQKPTPDEQQAKGAINRYGQSIMDIGVMNLDAATAAAMLRMCQASPDASGKLAWAGPVAQAILSHGLDFYLEICCALGSDATGESYKASVRACGAKLDDSLLNRVFSSLSGTPFAVQVLPRCGFLHFGTTRQMIASGMDLLRSDLGVSHLDSPLSINNEITDQGRIIGANSWVEGCRIRCPLTLGGQNVIVGADIDQPVSLPAGTCLDVIPGRDRAGQNVWFVRWYGVDDTFKDALETAAFCGMSLVDWLAAVGARPEDVWDPQLPPERRTLWEARVFPVEATPLAYGRWVWMLDPAAASQAERRSWLAAPRCSAAEIAVLADLDAFGCRRAEIRAKEIRNSLRGMFRPESGLSAADLAWVLAHTEDRASFVAELLAEAHGCFGDDKAAASLESLEFSRVIHALAEALLRLSDQERLPLLEALPGLDEMLAPHVRQWLGGLGLAPAPGAILGDWARHAQAAAFEHLGQTIVSSGAARPPHPTSALRGDRIVWGRAPARVDLGGGWSDTPPYSLEHGGCVINVALNLNGQPPIQCYARVIPEPLVRITSIDLGSRIQISDLEDLLNYREATGEFALAKAALALSGFSPETAAWPGQIKLGKMLELFGGGIELTTLAAVPKGSGLGTSSIVGAVILSVVQRVMGRKLTRRELFHGVLRMEQALTTGGGWQDQVGGCTAGVKLITASPGLIPDVSIHYVPGDVLDPKVNGGCTLLYYTGITRLAKNILQHVVGRYLNRDRHAMATLRQIHALPPHLAEAMARMDLPAFGRLLDVAWRLNKQLDPDSSNEQIEALLGRIRGHIHGAKLAGAGGGGFLLMVCKSPADAASVREILQADPPNEKARFFDFDIAGDGLVVTVC